MNIEDLKKIIISSNNYSEVLRKIDLVTTNGNYHTLKKIIKINNLDVSHFNRKTKKDNSTFDKINLDEVLKKNTNYNSTRIRNRLISEGIKEHKCENCKNTEWLNKPIPLQLHHINGVRSDNTIENLRVSELGSVINQINVGLRADNTSGYKGVIYREKTGKWEVMISYKNKRIWLGAYKNKEMAAIKYNEKALELFGDACYLNKINITTI
jgi:hypothetical protein